MKQPHSWKSQNQFLDHLIVDYILTTSFESEIGSLTLKNGDTIELDSDDDFFRIFHEEINHNEAYFFESLESGLKYAQTFLTNHMESFKRESLLEQEAAARRMMLNIGTRTQSSKGMDFISDLYES